MNSDDITIFANSCFCSLHRDDNSIVFQNFEKPFSKGCMFRPPKYHCHLNEWPKSIQMKLLHKRTHSLVLIYPVFPYSHRLDSTVYFSSLFALSFQLCLLILISFICGLSSFFRTSSLNYIFGFINKDCIVWITSCSPLCVLAHTPDS